MPHSITRSHGLIGFRPALIAVVAVLALAPRVEAQNEALLRLLQVLRDRGSITAQEYEEIRKVAESPQTPSAGQVGALESGWRNKRRRWPQSGRRPMAIHHRSSAARSPANGTSALVFVDTRSFE